MGTAEGAVFIRGMPSFSWASGTVDVDFQCDKFRADLRRSWDFKNQKFRAPRWSGITLSHCSQPIKQYRQYDSYKVYDMVFLSVDTISGVFQTFSKC